MNRREASELLPLVRALSLGQLLQYQDTTGVWHDSNASEYGPAVLAKEWKWRVKPPAKAKEIKVAIEVLEIFEDGSACKTRLGINPAEIMISNAPYSTGHDAAGWATYEPGEEIYFSAKGKKDLVAAYDLEITEGLRERGNRVLDQAIEELKMGISPDAKEKLKSLFKGLF